MAVRDTLVLGEALLAVTGDLAIRDDVVVVCFARH
jgi:hypothetical protein